MLNMTKDIFLNRLNDNHIPSISATLNAPPNGTNGTRCNNRFYQHFVPNGTDDNTIFNYSSFVFVNQSK